MTNQSNVDYFIGKKNIQPGEAKNILPVKCFVKCKYLCHHNPCFFSFELYSAPNVTIDDRGCIQPGMFWCCTQFIFKGRNAIIAGEKKCVRKRVVCPA